MADITLPSPTTPRLSQARLPQWAYWIILLLIIPAAAGTIYLTREYAVANLSLLQLDNDSLAARRLSIDVLLFVHVVAFFVAPVLFDTRLKWRRRQLLALGFAIWLFDCAALYQSRVGIMISADSVQTTASDRAAKKQETIDSLRRQVAGLQKLAATQLALDRVKAATATTAQATALEKEANQKASELEKEPAGTGLTEVKVWGAAAKWKALVESLLISAGTLVMLGVMGAIVRVMLERVAPSVEHAAATLSRSGNAPAKRGMGRALRAALAALGLGAAAASATASEAPKAPGASPAASMTHPVDDASQKGVGGVNVDTPAPGNGASELTHTAPAGASELTHTTPAGASKVTQQNTRKRTHKSTAVAAGAKCDTGTGEHDGARYRRVKAAVQARTLEPGLRPIQAAEGGGAPTVRGYLAKMCEEGVIRPKADGNGYELVNNGAAV